MIQYDSAVVIGRFSPFHNEHKKLIDEAIKLSKKVFIILGSVGGPRTNRTPFTELERSKMIRLVYPDRGQLQIIHQPDIPGKNDEWAFSIRQKLHERPSGNRRVLVSSLKEPEAWLNQLPTLFPDFEHRAVPHTSPICATDIRDIYFNINGYEKIKELVPSVVYSYLTMFMDSDHFWKAVDAHNLKERVG